MHRNCLPFAGLKTCLLIMLATVGTTLHCAPFVNFEGKQTAPIKLSPDRTRLFAVNTPDARLSVFDVTQPSNPQLIAEIPVGIEPISVHPRNNDEAWVVNEVSDSISIVSVSQRIVIDTLYVKDEPADIVFAGGKAFVTASRKNLIAVFDETTHTLITNISVLGENPRALAVGINGDKVYAAFALSGNRTTIVPPDKAPPQPPPTNIPNAPPQVSLIVDATDTNYTLPKTNIITFTMPDNDVVEIDVATLAVSRYFPRVGTVNLGLAVRPGSGELYVANTDARNLVRFEPNLRSHSVDNRVSTIDVSTGLRTHYDLNHSVDYAVLPNLSAKSNALAQPTALVFEPDGNTFYVAAFGSDRVAKVDANNPSNILARIELCPTASGSAADPRNMRGPRGLALNAVAQRLYVLNRIANSISIIDSSNALLVKEIPVGSHDPTPAVIRQGRGFLYDAKLSGNGTMACAACHIDADMDMIAWDLGDPAGQMQTVRTVLPIPFPPFFFTNVSNFHPMKGPMTTQTLRGLNSLEPFHWRGDRTNFVHFNIAFPSLMGSGALSGADMAAYRDYINTIVFQPNPNQNLDRTYPTNFAGGNAVIGREAFFTTNYAAGLTCHSCHTGPPGTGSNKLIIPADALDESQDFKVPQLRNIYQKLNFNNTSNAVSVGGYGIIHDGIDPTLQAFLSRAVFTNIRNNTAVKNNLAAFVQCFDTGTAPAVGYARTVSLANLGSLSISNDWSLLESQATLGNVDLIVKGTVDGHRRGFLYLTGSGTYRLDSTNLANMTRAQLVTKVSNGDRLTIMGVPPGSGTRMGIDRDVDGVLDGDLPPPVLHLAQTANQSVLDWPYSAAGFALEANEGLSPSGWTNVSDPVEVIANRNYVTNSVAAGTKFFRLRQP